MTYIYIYIERERETERERERERERGREGVRGDHQKIKVFNLAYIICCFDERIRN